MSVPAKAAKVVVAREVAKNATRTVKEKTSSVNVPKLILIVGSLYLGNKLINKARDTNTSNTYGEDQQTETDPATGKEVTWSASTLAAQYKNAMGGTAWYSYDGTDVKKLIELAEQSRGKRWFKISQAYNKLSKITLLQHLLKEVNSLELAAFNSVRADTNNDFKYSLNEILSFNTRGRIRVWNNEARRFENIFIGARNITGGTVTARVKSADGVGYKLSDYPKYSFFEKNLTRYYEGTDYELWTLSQKL